MLTLLCSHGQKNCLIFFAKALQISSHPQKAIPNSVRKSAIQFNLCQVFLFADILPLLGFRFLSRQELVGCNTFICVKRNVIEF